MGQKMFSSELWNNPGSTQVLTQRAIFAFGQNGGSSTAVSNLVSDEGTVASDTSGVGTARGQNLAAATYGEDKALFGFGDTGNGNNAVSLTNKVSNEGVVASDTSGVGTARSALAAAAYGGDKALFGFGISRSGGSETAYSLTNLVSNEGTVASDTAGAGGTARHYLAAAGFGGDKAIFGYGHTTQAFVGMTNLVSNEGVVASDTSVVGSKRGWLGAAGFGEDKAIFGFGFLEPGNANTAVTNLVSNEGVVASDTSGVGTARIYIAAAIFGGDKAIFGYGRVATSGSSGTAISNKVSNSGVVASDTSGVGSVRYGLGAAGFAN